MMKYPCLLNLTNRTEGYDPEIAAAVLLAAAANIYNNFSFDKQKFYTALKEFI